MRTGKYRSGDRVALVSPAGETVIMLRVCPACDDPQYPHRPGCRGGSRPVCATCGGWGCVRADPALVSTTESGDPMRTPSEQARHAKAVIRWKQLDRMLAREDRARARRRRAR